MNAPAPRVAPSVLPRLAMRGVLAASALLLLAGCGTAYLAQAVGGHLDLLQRARPVPDWIADPDTPPALRERLLLSQRMREFAVRELALPDSASYRRFAQLERPAAVWNVVAAPELSLTLKTWCFPVAGCVGYRGYFDRAQAEAFAATLQRGQGLETRVYPVPAYSTLGRTDWLGGDPLLSTFIHWPEAELARLLFHEMAHQVVYVGDDTAFNEGYATAVERLGLRRWLAGADDALRLQEARSQARRRDFLALTRHARDDLDALYRSRLAPDEQRARKAQRLQQLRDEHARLKAQAWAGFSGYDAWFDQVNNAALAVQGAYDDLAPAFEQLFEREGADFPAFHAAVRRLAALPRAERRSVLAQVSAPGKPARPVPP